MGRLERLARKRAATVDVKLSKRVRTRPHTPGSWPAYIYVKVPPLSDRLLDADASRHLPCSADFIPDAELHISLSKQLYLKHFQIQPLVTALTTAVARLRMPAFQCDYGPGVCILRNEEDTRCFAALSVSAGRPELTSLTAEIDSVLARFGHPVFHDPAIFHTSFSSWLPQDGHSQRLEEEQAVQQLVVDDGEPFCVSEVHISAGGKDFLLPL
ncbi:MAG: hypothetical protein SGCHY_000406 [Lobulomycetales sp.]